MRAAAAAGSDRAFFRIANESASAARQTGASEMNGCVSVALFFLRAFFEKKSQIFDSTRFKII